jgi:hypothetical protein
MSLQNESRERPDGRRVRYAVVGAGWISQENFMPSTFLQILLCVTIERAFVK